jgi:hypothetical protein
LIASRRVARRGLSLRSIDPSSMDVIRPGFG